MADEFCLAVWSSICDFFFAIFPWLFIWSLRMPKRDKIMLAGGMSLGVIAGVCGIIRTVVLARLDVYNYTRKSDHLSYSMVFIND